MSISNLAASRKRIRKPFISIIVVSVIIIFLSTCISGTALAGEVGDVVSKVVNSHYQSPEFEFGAEEVTGYGFKMHAGYGGYANGFGGISVLGPVESGDMNILLNYVDSQAQHTSIQTTKMKGCEVREYTMPDGNGVGVILPDYFITVETYQSGNSSSTDFQKAKIIAQQVLDGLESNGLLSQPAPEIDKPVPEEQTDAEAVTGNESMVSGIPLGDPVAVSDTMNIAGVYNGPTAPTVFSISSPHLVTYICTYHWNNAQGAAPGTIALQHSDGTVYGPWQVSTRPGQGGVPNAYWEVTPNVVIPAGTYTVIDSDPATWAQNGESGGRGMGEVRATPYFEITGGSADNIHGGGKTSPWGGYIESPAGVGSVGNIPGPSNTTEAIVGVAVPGLIATALGALAGLGGGGGFTPSGGTPLSPGGGSVPGNGGPYPGRPAQEATQLGRKRRDEVYVSGPESDPGIIIDTAEMGEGIITVQEIIIDTDEMGQGSITVPGRDGILIEPAEEAGIFVKSEAEMIIETADEEAILVQTEPGLIIETAQEEAGVIRQGSDVLIDNTDSGILIDTSALEDEIPVGTEGHKSPADASDITGENVYDQEGYDQAGFDAEGFDKAGYDANGFDQEGYNQAGYDREGFNREGFDKAGYDREGYDKSGFDAEGFDKEGFDKAGYDRDGYGRSGYDAEGYNREGYDVNGYDRKGYNRSGYDAQGYNKQGYDREGFDKDGWDRDGYNRQGLDHNGYDREGFDKDGYDREGYNRDGHNREGQSKEGYDEYGYDKKGFNKDGYDRDGFDREGFDYEGYNRSGYDPWGFDRQGYGKDGYHWSGYNADGYNRDGRHWSENPFEGDGNPFNVAVQDPFGEGEVIPFGTKWVPVKPKLGEPYPRTAEKYGAKPWTDEIPKGEPEVPSGPSSSASGVIGPEDPMNTLEKHDVGGGDSSQPPADQSVKAGDNDSFTYTDPETGQTSSYEYEKGYTGPRHGETQVLVGKTDGRPYELEFDAVKGKWINTESGNEFNPDDFERWQNDLAEDKRRIAIDLEKMAERQDATSKAIKQNMDDWQKLEQMQKAADKYNIGQPGGPGDVDKAIQKLKDDMLAGKELDREQVDKIRRVIDNRILGKTAADTGERWEELPWYKDIGSALKANAAMAKEVVTAQKEDGSISWLGLAARTMIIAASGGAATVSGVVMDGTLTVAEAMLRIQESIEKGESDFVAVSKALGITILGEEIGWLAGKAGGAIMGEMLEKFPVFTNKAADFIETALLKIMKADQIASRSLGMISKESAEEMLGQIEKRLTDLAGDAAEESMEKVFKGAGRGAAGSVDDIATRAGKSVSGSTDDLGKGSGKTAGSGADDLGKGSGKTAGSSADDLGKGSGKTAGSGADDLGKGSGKTSSAGPDVEGTEKTPFVRKESDAPGTGKTASGSSDNMPDGTRKTTADEGVPKSSDSSDRVGKTTPSSPDGPDGPRKPASGSGGDGPDPGGKIPGKDEGPVSSSLPKVNDYYGQAGKQVEVDNYAHINMDMDRVRQTMEANKLVAGDNGAVYAAPPKAGVPGYEYTNTTTVRISNQNLVDVRIRTGSGGQMQYVTPKGEVIDPSLLKDKVLMTPNSEGTGVILTYYDPQGQVRSYIPARFLERWSDAVNGFAPMG